MLWTVSFPRKWSIRKIWSSSQRAQDAGIQLARRVQAMAERLLDHHAAPELGFPVLGLVLIGQLRLAELLHHGAEEPVGDGEIEDDVALRAMGLLGLVKRAAELLVQLGLGEVALHVDIFSASCFHAASSIWSTSNSAAALPTKLFSMS